MIKLYYHNGSDNHGCEAIVRTTRKMICKDMVLFSRKPEKDKKYGVDHIVEVDNDEPIDIPRKSIRYILSAVYRRICDNNMLFVFFQRLSFFSKVNKGDWYLSIGGDNYCYAGRDVLGYYNRIIHKKGGKTVLWGCSFEPEDMTPDIAKDMALYDLITVRESLSFAVLSQYNKQVYLVPDPAFQLEAEEIALPQRFVRGNMVGINVSPLIISRENETGITMKNYECLLEYILECTDMNIALIPHVVSENSDDRIPLKQLYDRFCSTERIVMVEDCNCNALKYIISQCRFFVGARTHATIAAYSTFVPTLVVGYSVKARGIAKDLFDTEENYVISVQSMKENDELLLAFQWLVQEEENIKETLKKKIPSYCERAMEGAELLRHAMSI